MRRFILAIASILMLAAGPWPATDLLAAEYNWTGFYVGVSGGGAFGGDVKARDLGNGTVFYNGPNRWEYDLASSFIAGGQLGYNYQISPFVLGVEGEGGYLRLKDSKVDPGSPGGDTSSRSRIGDWYSVIAGRLGYAVDRALVYGKAGVGVTRLQSIVIDSCITPPCGGGLVYARGHDVKANLAIGGGLEYAFANNLSMKAEYLFMNTDNTITSSGQVPGAAGNFRWRHDFDGFHTMKLGLNYKFGF